MRKLYRGLEMSAGIMRDRKRTGGWGGADRTADAFARYAATAQSLHALLSAARAAPPAIDREAVQLDWRLVAKLAGEHGVRYRTNRAFEQFVTAILSTLSADAIRGGVEIFTGVEAWDELVNVDDRTSPEDYPDMCLITRDELIDFMSRATPASDPGEDAQLEIYRQAERDRDALLAAIGFRAGPLDNELSRKVILEDAAGLRGEMVKARQAAQQAEGDALIYHVILGDFVHDSRSGVLGRMWEELTALRSKVIRIPTHLEPDAADVAMLLNGTLSGCAHCGGTPTTFARYFGHSRIFQQHVSCSRCHASVLVNDRDREEARRLAIAAWDRRPAAVAGGSIHSIPPGFTLHEVEMDAECGCPEETWDTPYGSLNMHLTGKGASNAHLDNGDGGEWSKELTFPTIAEARAAFFGWTMGIDQGLPSEEAVGRWGSIAAYRGPVVELKAERPYYLASCDHCGWVGSSEKCGTDTSGDDSSVYCPRCHLPGADCGKVADAIPAAEAGHG
ncbi:Lar family restriction alleviation protein [Sphingomonas pseudosanguinis]|uniref:Lar family restriction alleviation protein n=1 Tax=Sphingomonas pseudosanguinis TaxID=413712 RepID=UPI00391C5EAA